MIVRRNFRHGERGQVLILCAVFMVVLLLFVGLAIDFGFAYVTKARLGKAVDAAALACARYSAQGSTQSQALAQSTFNLNYSTSDRDTAPPVVTIPPFTTDASGNTLINVSASVTTRTFFLGLLPSFRTLNISSAAQSRAATVLMTLVLDRTGSMGPVSSGGDGGEAMMPGAVSDFISYFDDTKDSVALVSFANDVKVEVPMTTGSFRQAVINATNAMVARGATWSDGALQQALVQENKLALPAGVYKTVVFFTDGNANTLQESVTCKGGTETTGTWNIGGSDNSSWIGFLVPGTNPSTVSYPNCAEGGDPSDTSCCHNGTFYSHVAGKQMPLNWTNIAGTTAPYGDALYRAIADANAMRAQGITVYSIGLASAPASVNQTFLCQIANAPCSPNYDSTQPVGDMVLAQTASGLAQAFQTVATEIRLRLTQ